MSPRSDRLPMRFGAMVLGYNQEDYIEYCLSEICGEVDLVVVALPESPFTAYNPAAREEFTAADATQEIVDRVAAQWRHVRVRVGSWSNEESMRDHCLDIMRDSKIDVCMIIDADEFYPTGTLAAIRCYISDHASPGDVLWARYVNCFKRYDHVIDAPRLRLPVAVVVDAQTRFLEGRCPEGVRLDLPENLFYWHVGYVMSDRRMWEKIRTFSHAHEVAPRWFEEKWLAWTPQSTNLCRRQPDRWPRTIKINRTALPQVLHSHPRFLDETSLSLDDK